MPTGVIKSWLVPYSFAPWTACFGYIKPDSGGPSIYGWSEKLTPPLQTPYQSQKVTYDIGTNPNTGSPCATNVKLNEPPLPINGPYPEFF